MAITLSPVLTFSVTFEDRDNNRSTVGGYLPSATTAAAVQTWLTTDFIPAVQGISNAVVIAYNVSYSATDVIIQNTDAPEASDVERKAVFKLLASNKGKSRIEVPSVDNAFVVDGSKVLDIAAPEVQAVIAALTTAGTGGVQPASFYNSTFTGITAIPYKRHTGSNEG